MYGCENWTIKKAECWRINAFELWCWWRLLTVPWTGRRSNQSILKEINPEYSLEGLILKLRLWYFSHLMQKGDSLEKNPDARKDWRQEKKRATEGEMDGWLHWLNGHEFEHLWEMVKDREAWRAAVHRVAKSRTRLNDWTTTAHESRRYHAVLCAQKQMLDIGSVTQVSA